jgi:hypothetical protein
MKTVVAVYTSRGNVEDFARQFAASLPGVRLINLVDDSVIPDIMTAGGVTPAIAKRLLLYFLAAESMSPDLILMTCSSAGEVVDLGRQVIGAVPLLRIDEPMAAEAVRSADRVGVLATLPTTLDPTSRLIRQQAAMLGKPVSVEDGLAEGAFQVLRQGQPGKHDEMVVEAAVRIAGRVDTFVLAQASMARVEATIRERTGKPVLSSPGLCLQHLRTLLGE